MVELRKRKEAPTAPPPLVKRNSGTAKNSTGPSTLAKFNSKIKSKLGVRGGDTEGATTDPASASTSIAPPEKTTESGSTAMPEASTAAANGSKIEAGSEIPFASNAAWGGEVEKHDGDEVKFTLAKLVEESNAGVVVFTYPKASTPGCTTQGCLFRDSYLPITGAGLAVYGLSSDSPKSNTTFATKQSFPFSLLCDPSGSLIKALGLGKPGNKTARGVVVIDKSGTVKVHVQGGPQATLDAVLNYIKEGGMEMGAPAAVAALPADDPKATEAAAKLAEPEVVGLPVGGDNLKETMPTEMEGVEKFDEVPLIKEASKEEEEAAKTAAEVSESAKMVDD